MWRTALLGLALLLPGCAGVGDFVGDTFTYRTNPNRPLGNSENMRRVTGHETVSEPLLPEPGNVWPGPIQPTPTLQDLEQQGGTPAAAPSPNLGPYLPDHRQPRPATPPGSSTPPGSNQPPLATVPGVPPPALPSGLSATPPPAPVTSGRAVTTRQGPGVTSGGTGGYETLTTPQGQAIVVPNGNGTSTVIHPDGTVETIPTPR